LRKKSAVIPLFFYNSLISTAFDLGQIAVAPWLAKNHQPKPARTTSQFPSAIDQLAK
jgi:hypothetical protein